MFKIILRRLQLPFVMVKKFIIIKQFQVFYIYFFCYPDMCENKLIGSTGKELFLLFDLKYKQKKELKDYGFIRQKLETYPSSSIVTFMNDLTQSQEQNQRIIFQQLPKSFNSGKDDVYIFLSGHSDEHENILIQNSGNIQSKLEFKRIAKIWRDREFKQNYLYIFINSNYSGKWCEENFEGDIENIIIVSSCKSYQQFRYLRERSRFFVTIFSEAKYFQQNQQIMMFKQNPQLGTKKFKRSLKKQELKDLNQNITNIKKIREQSKNEEVNNRENQERGDLERKTNQLQQQNSIKNRNKNLNMQKKLKRQKQSQEEIDYKAEILRLREQLQKKNDKEKQDAKLRQQNNQVIQKLFDNTTSNQTNSQKKHNFKQIASKMNDQIQLALLKGFQLLQQQQEPRSNNVPERINQNYFWWKIFALALIILVIYWQTKNATITKMCLDRLHSFYQSVKKVIPQVINFIKDKLSIFIDWIKKSFNAVRIIFEDILSQISMTLIRIDMI